MRKFGILMWTLLLLISYTTGVSAENTHSLVNEPNRLKTPMPRTADSTPDRGDFELVWRETKTQAISTVLSEDFEGGGTPALPVGWTTENPNGGDVFFTGDYNDANAGTYWPVAPHTTFAMANDDVCNCNMSDVRLISPPMDLPAGTTPVLKAWVWAAQVYTAEVSTVQIDPDGDGLGWIDVLTIPPLEDWQQITVDLSAYAGNPNAKIGFHFNDVGGWGQGLAVDDVLVTLNLEDFEGGSPPALPVGWTTENPNGGDVFFTGDYNDANAGSYWPIAPHTIFAMANDDVCNCDMSDVRLISPPVDLATKPDPVLKAWVWAAQVYTAEVSKVQIDPDGSGWVDLLTIPPLTDWQQITVDLSPYIGYPDARIGFHFDDVGGWGQGLAVDDVQIISMATLDSDVGITSTLVPGGQYTKTPWHQFGEIAIGATVEAFGPGSHTNVTLTADVLRNGAIVHTDSASVADIPTGTDWPFVLPPFIPSFEGSYTVEYSVSMDETDTNAGNDLAESSTIASGIVLARGDGSVANGGFGVGSGDGEIGHTVTLTAPSILKAVRFYHVGNASDPSQSRVFNIRSFGTEGPDPTPGAVIATTVPLVLPPGGSNHWFQAQIVGGEITLPAGTYFIGALEDPAAPNASIGGSPDIYTPLVNWVNWPGSPTGGWVHPEDLVSAFAVAFEIVPVLYAGPEVIFIDDFELGDTTAWDG